MANIRKLRRSALIFLVGVYVVATIIWGIGEIKDNKAEEALKEKTDKVITLLNTASAFAPTNVKAGSPLSVVSFTDAEDKAVSLNDYKGKNLVLLFWVSSDNNCKALLNQVTDLQQACQEANAELILIDKLDGTTETIETAKAYLTSINYNGISLYDKELAAYNMLGLKTVPTIIIMNGQGNVVLSLGGTISTVEGFKSVLDYAVNLQQ